MIKIRLKRLGNKKNPIYRIVILNAEQKREGRTLDEVGHYNPKTKEIRLDKAAAKEWIRKGAQPTDTVKYLLEKTDDNGKFIVVEAVVEKKLSRKAKAKQEAEQKAAAAQEA